MSYTVNCRMLLKGRLIGEFGFLLSFNIQISPILEFAINNELVRKILKASK